MELRAPLHRFNSPGVQLTIICWGTMTCGTPSMTCVVIGTARAGAANASAAAIAIRSRRSESMEAGMSNAPANFAHESIQ